MGFRKVPCEMNIKPEEKVLKVKCSKTLELFMRLKVQIINILG